MSMIKVLPVAPDDVGIVHPTDGSLAAEGSSWTFDAFTMRQLDAGRIRRFEVGADDVTKPAATPPAAMSNTSSSAPPVKPAQAAEPAAASEPTAPAGPAATAPAAAPPAAKK